MEENNNWRNAELQDGNQILKFTVRDYDVFPEHQGTLCIYSKNGWKSKLLGIRFSPNMNKTVASHRKNMDAWNIEKESTLEILHARFGSTDKAEAAQIKYGNPIPENRPYFRIIENDEESAL